ncbi:response regulator transcription factor [Streptomyces sp. GTA36]
MRLLLIDDDDRIAVPLSEGLGRYGFAVDRARTGAAALAAPAADLVLLDLGLPDMDGIDVCRALRSRSDVPLIIITARGEEADRIVGLELGADDYLTKPFAIRELVARIRAVMRRTRGADHHLATANPGPPPPPAIATAVATQCIGPLTIDARTHHIDLSGVPVALTPKEFGVLTFLAQDPGAVYSRQQILNAVWDSHFFGPTRTLDVHVAALRRKLGDPAWIETVRRVGFRLTVPTGRHPHPAAEGLR